MVTYTVSDADGDQATATVSLTITAGTGSPVGGDSLPTLVDTGTVIGQGFAGNIFGDTSSTTPSTTGNALPTIDPSTLWSFDSPGSAPTGSGPGTLPPSMATTGGQAGLDPLAIMNGGSTGSDLLAALSGAIDPSSSGTMLDISGTSLGTSTAGSASSGMTTMGAVTGSASSGKNSTGTAGTQASTSSRSGTSSNSGPSSATGGAGTDSSETSGTGGTDPTGTTGGAGQPQTDAEKDAARAKFLDVGTIAAQEKNAAEAGQKISRGWQDKINSAQASLSKDIQKLIDNEIADRKAGKLSNLNKAKEAAKREADANQAVEDKFNSQQQSAQDALKSDTDKADADFGAAKDAANNLHQQTVDAAQSEFDATTASANSGYESEVGTANSDYTTGMAAIESAWDTAMAGAEAADAATEGASATAFQSAMTSATTSYEAAEAAAKSAWDAIQAAYSSITIDWSLIGSDATFITDRDAANNAFDTELDRISGELQTNVAAATGLYSTSMTNAKSAFDGTLNGANTKYDEQTTAAVKAYNTAINSASKTFHDGLTNERTALNMALTTAETDHSDAISGADTAYSDAVSDAESAYNASVKEAQETYRKFLVATYGDATSAGSLVDSRWGLEEGFLTSLFGAANAFTTSVKNLNDPITAKVVAGATPYDAAVRGAVTSFRAEALTSFKTYQDAVKERQETYRAAETALQFSSEGMTPEEVMMTGAVRQLQVDELKRAFLVGVADDETKFVTDIGMMNAGIVSAERGAAKIWMDGVADAEYSARNTDITAGADLQKAKNEAGATFVKGLASLDIATQVATQAKLIDLQDAIVRASEARQNSLAGAQAAHTGALATAETNYANAAKLAIDNYVTHANELWTDLEAAVQIADAAVVPALTTAANAWTTTVTAAQTKLTRDQTLAYETLTNSVWTDYMASVGESIAAGEIRSASITTAATAAAHRVYTDADSWAVVTGALAYTTSISSAHDAAIGSIVGAAEGYVTSATSAAASHDNAIASAAAAAAAATGQQSVESAKSAALHNAGEKKDRTLADAKQALDSALLQADLAKEASLTSAAATQATARAAAQKRFAADDAAAQREAVIDQNAAARREFKALTTDQIAEFTKLVDAKLKSANTQVDLKTATDRSLAEGYRDGVKAASQRNLEFSSIVTRKRTMFALQEIRDRQARLSDPVGRPSDTFSTVDVLSFNVAADGVMRASTLGQRHLDWLNQTIPQLQGSAMADALMRSLGYNTHTPPDDLAQAHLLRLAGAPDVAKQFPFNNFQFSAVPASQLQLDVGDLRKHWNIIKQPSWGDLLDDPDLKDQLLKELTAVLGDRAASFLDQQGISAAKEILKATAAGWTLKFASLVTVCEKTPDGTVYVVHGDYKIDQSPSAAGVTRTITINLSRATGIGDQRSATAEEINAAINAAVRDERVTDFGTGIRPLDSAAAAAFEGFTSHPNAANAFRFATATLQIGLGGAAILMPTGGVTQVFGAISATSGFYEALAAIEGAIKGEYVRSGREQVVDQLTENQQTTNKILFWTDLGIDFAGGALSWRAMLKNGKAVAAGTPLGGRGPISGREFDLSNAGGPIRQLTTDRLKITNRGIDYAEQHLARFGPDPANQGMVQRLRDIASGKLKPTQTDLNFYSHELRESIRYKQLGFPSGQPSGVDAAYDLWNNAHTATLEDYLLREGPGIRYPSVNP